MDYKRGYHDCPLNCFCLIVPKSSNEKLFFGQESFVIEKNFMDKKKLLPRLSVEVLCLRVAKNLVGKPYVVQNVSGIEEKLWVKKASKGNLHKLRRSFVIQKIFVWDGVEITIFRGEASLSQCRKSS